VIDASLRRLACAGILGLGIAALGGCNTETPSAPGAEKPLLGFRPAGGIRTTTSTLGVEEFKVCKSYVGQVGPAVTVDIAVDQGNNGSVDDNIQITVADGQCWLVWEAGGDVTDKLTVTEVVPTDYAASFVVDRLLGNNTTVTTLPAAGNSAIETIINGGNPKGIVVRFTNTFVPVGTGCTLTQGYWKTHSTFGPAPNDPRWVTTATPLGPNTLFFNSGKTWYEIYQMPPSGGNAYLQLAHQYMAAKLNILNGASSTSAVDAAITAAEAYFAGKGAGVTSESSKTVSATIKGYAATLASFNEGDIGPGHCPGLDVVD